MNILIFVCGCSVPIIFGSIVLISEFCKFGLSWDGRYSGMSWIQVCRAERAFRRGDMKTYYQIMGWQESP